MLTKGINSYRLVCIFLALCCLCAALFSCNTKTNEIPNHSALLSTNEDTKALEYSYCYIILPSECSSALALRVQALEKELAEQIQVQVESVYSGDSFIFRENSLFLLIGNTLFTESTQTFALFKRDDYICKNISGKIVLGGISDSATVKAIDKFCEEVLPYADASSILSVGGEFLYKAEYPHESISLNGFPVGEYKIVYREVEDASVKTVALAMREAIADLCGEYLGVISEDSVKGDTKAITLGISQDSEARLFSSENGVEITASDAHSLACCAQQLAEACAENPVLTVNEELKFNTSISTVAVLPLLCTIDASNANSELQAIVDLTRTVLDNGASAFFTDGLTDRQSELFLSSLSGYVAITDNFYINAQTQELISSESVNADGFNLCVYTLRIKNSKHKYKIITAVAGENGASVPFSNLSQYITDSEPTFVISSSQSNTADFSIANELNEKTLCVDCFIPEQTDVFHGESSLTFIHEYLRQAYPPAQN